MGNLGDSSLAHPGQTKKKGGEIPFKLQGGKNGMCVIFILRSCPKSLASGNKFLWAGAPSQHSTVAHRIGM